MENKMKIKIRKVEVTPHEFFDALYTVLEVHERIPAIAYIGSHLDFICKTMGIKKLEFWKMKFENEALFKNNFEIIQMQYDTNDFYLWRKETYDICHKTSEPD